MLNSQNLVLLLLLLQSGTSSNNLTLLDVDGYKVVDNSVSTGPISYVNIDNVGAMVVASYSSTLQIMSVTNNGTIDNTSAYNVNLPQNVVMMKFSDDGGWMAAIDNTGSKVHFLKENSSLMYSVDHSIDVGSRANSIGWVGNDNSLAVGLDNNSIAILFYNSQNNTFYVASVINTDHTGGVSHIVSRNASIYSVGRTDTVLSVYQLNTISHTLSLNQTVTGIGATGTNSSALHVSRNEKRAGIGRSNGDIVILIRDASGNWVIDKTLGAAHAGTSIKLIILTSEAQQRLLTCGGDTLQLRTISDNWTTPYRSVQTCESADWDSNHTQFVVGQVGVNSGRITIQKVSDCPNGTQFDSNNETKCICTNNNNGNGSCNCIYNSMSCQCIAGQHQDNTTSICVPDQDCTDMAFSNGTNVNGKECSCYINYSWDASTHKCTSTDSMTTNTSKTITITFSLIGLVVLILLTIGIYFLVKKYLSDRSKSKFLPKNEDTDQSGNNGTFINTTIVKESPRNATGNIISDSNLVETEFKTIAIQWSTPIQKK